MQSFKVSLVGVAIVGLLVYGCSSGAAQGSEGGACYPNATCDKALSCLSNLCVNAGGDSGSDTGAADTSAADVSNDAPSESSIDAGDGGLPPYVLWLRADMGVATDGSGVTTWLDQSANTVSFPRCTISSSSYPQLVASAINGHPAVNIVGPDLYSTCHLAGNAPSFAGMNGPVLVEIVFGKSGAGLAANFLWDWTFGIQLKGSQVAVSGPGADGGGQLLTGTSNLTNAPWHLLGFYRDSANLVTLRVDGASDGTATMPGTFDYPATVYLSDASFAEVIMIAGALTPQQIDGIETALKTKYAL